MSRNCCVSLDASSCVKVDDEKFIFRFGRMEFQDVDHTCEEMERRGKRQGRKEIRTVVAAKGSSEEARKRDIKKQ